MPFEEIPHSADWCLRVRAEGLEALFAEAALGMNDLAGIQVVSEPRKVRRLDLRADDAESLLVAFLSELVYAADQERLAFDRFDLRIESTHLEGILEGGKILRQEKLIKAVTYHNLVIRNTSRGFQVEIVFDV